MKPIEGTFAENALRHGVAGLAIDACRIGVDNRCRPPRVQNMIYGGGSGTNLTASESNPLGRFPANVIHDASAEVLAGFPESKSVANIKSDGRTVFKAGNSLQLGKAGVHTPENSYSDSGSAARFFHAVEEYEDEGEQ